MYKLPQKVSFDNLPDGASVMGNPAVKKFTLLKIIKKLMLVNKIDFTEIKRLIPHREPFLLIDELINIEKLNKAAGNLQLMRNFLMVIFLAILWLGVLLIEMMAQTAAH